MLDASLLWAAISAPISSGPDQPSLGRMARRQPPAGSIVAAEPLPACKFSRILKATPMRRGAPQCAVIAGSKRYCLTANVLASDHSGSPTTIQGPSSCASDVAEG